MGRARTRGFSSTASRPRKNDEREKGASSESERQPGDKDGQSHGRGGSPGEAWGSLLPAHARGRRPSVGRLLRAGLRLEDHRRDTDHPSFDDGTGHVSGAWVTDQAISREPGLLPYIYVDRIDETLEQVEAQGGEVVKAPYPEGNLWVGTFRDPSGNGIGLWQGGNR